MDLKLLRKKAAPLVYLMQKILFRMTLYSFLILTFAVSLYIAGNFQHFLDSNQELILNQIIFMAITLCFFSIISIIFTVLDAVLSKFFSWKKAVVLGFYVFDIVMAIVCGGIGRGIITLSLGHSS